MTPSPMMGLLLVELIFLLSSMTVLADMENNKTVSWPDGGNSDFALKDYVEKERSKRDTGSDLIFSLLYFCLHETKFNHINSWSS